LLQTAAYRSLKMIGNADMAMRMPGPQPCKFTVVKLRLSL